MIRRIGILLLLPMLLLALSACGGDEEAAEEPQGTPMPPQILELGDKFQCNIMDDPGAYVYCKISLEAASEEDLAALSMNVPYIRDIINSILRSKTMEELSRTDVQSMLRNEISAQIKAAFGLEDMKGVYFEGYMTAQP